jgi:hypothetical protein
MLEVITVIVDSNYGVAEDVTKLLETVNEWESTTLLLVSSEIIPDKNSNE